jgi:arylsulfatase A
MFGKARRIDPDGLGWNASQPVRNLTGILRFICLFLFGNVGLYLQAAKESASQPNIILIFCDDLGYADIGPFGSEKHRTPNLDHMAAEGRKFTSFYVTSGVCTPSRASLMTGCYPQRVGLHENETGRWVLFPGNSRGLNPKETTMAEMLKASGYATAIVGKWHLGDQPEFLPTRHGFDYYFGIPFSNDMGRTSRVKNRYPPLPLLRMEKVIEEEPDQRLLTQRYTAEAVRFIEQNKAKPFFLYLPHTMPHWPQFSSERFAGKSANGKWGDTVEEIDWSTGEILKALKQNGIDKKTLVVFMSDNGGAIRHGASNKPLKAGKGSTWEGGQRVPFLIRWPGTIPAGTASDEMVTSMDLLPTFAALAGGKLDSNRKIDGKNIRDLLLATPGAKSPHELFVYFHQGQLHGVRSGKWKMLFSRDDNSLGRPAGLFDLENDIGEKKNVLHLNRAVAKRLAKLAEPVRVDLGDSLLKVKGNGVRPAGMVKSPKTLTQK